MRREDIETLLDEVEREARQHRRRLELDARVLGKLHTFYGHNKPSGDPTLITAAFRRTQDLLRGR